MQDHLDHSSGEWKQSLISQIFNKEEAEQICNIPVSRFGAEDKLVWRLTKIGHFTVRSAYHLELERKTRSKGETSRPHPTSTMWKRIWNLVVPAVVKHFL